MLKNGRAPCHAAIFGILLLLLAGFETRAWSILPRKTSVVPKTASPEVRSKSRPKVTFDYNSGAVINPPPPNKWKTFKGSLYGAADRVGNLASKIRKKKSSYIEEGYKDSIERRIISTSLEKDDITPGERLIRQYRQQQSNKEVKIVQREEPVFELLKEKIYSATDNVKLGSRPSQEQSKNDIPSQYQPYTTSVRPKIASSPVVKSLLPELKSQNPLKRWNAERQIRKWEKEQRQREIMLQREEQVRALKATIYTVVDTAAGAAEMVANAPSAVVETAEAAQRNAIELSGSLQSSARAVANIPFQVSKTAKDIQGSVESTVESTKQFVEDVASIPGELQRTMDNTKDVVKQTVKTIDDAFTSVQVMTGLKERPPPPPPPPKKLTVKNLALDLAGSVAKGGAQAAWWLGKEVIGIGWRGAKATFTSISQSKKEEKTAAKKAELSLRTSAETFPTPPKEPPSQELLLKKQSSRNKELEDAVERVKVAAMAATQEALEVEEAVRKAKAAAMAATKDDSEVEE